jgi:hypothetical protein
MRSALVTFAVLVGLLVACSSSSTGTGTGTSSGSSGSSSGGSGSSGSSGTGDGGGTVVPEGGHACKLASDCPPNPGAACVKVCPDGSNPCATVCVNGLCGLAGCP